MSIHFTEHECAEALARFTIRYYAAKNQEAKDMVLDNAVDALLQTGKLDTSAGFTLLTREEQLVCFIQCFLSTTNLCQFRKY